MGIKELIGLEADRCAIVLDPDRNVSMRAG
jgi:hypothetical protein